MDSNTTNCVDCHMAVYHRLALASILTLTGCAGSAVSTGYSLASTGTWAVTGKSFTDRAVEQVVPHSDCSLWNIVDHLHYCEIQDPSKTYNRNTL